MPEYGLQLLQVKQWGRPEFRRGGISMKAAVRTKNMQMRMPSQEITESMYGNDRPWNCALFRYGFLEEFLQSFPGTTGEIGKQLSVVQEIPAEDFRYAKHKIAVGYGLEDFLTQPFAKFHHALLMTRGAEVPALTRKPQQIFVTAGFTFHPREAVMENAAVQKTQ